MCATANEQASTVTDTALYARRPKQVFTGSLQLAQFPTSCVVENTNITGLAM